MYHAYILYTLHYVCSISINMDTWVFPPVTSCITDRDSDPEETKQEKNEPTRLVTPWAKNSWRQTIYETIHELQVKHYKESLTQHELCIHMCTLYINSSIFKILDSRYIKTHVRISIYMWYTIYMWYINIPYNRHYV